MIQIAIEASKCGMRAIAFKDHWNISATSAYLTQRYIDDMIARGELTKSSPGVWRRRHVLRYETRVCPGWAAVPKFQNDLVSYFYLLWLLARRRPPRKRGRSPVQRRRQG